MTKTTIENQYIINYFRENAKKIWSVSEMFVLLHCLLRERPYNPPIT